MSIFIGLSFNNDMLYPLKKHFISTTIIHFYIIILYIFSLSPHSIVHIVWLYPQWRMAALTLLSSIFVASVNCLKRLEYLGYLSNRPIRGLSLPQNGYQKASNCWVFGLWKSICAIQPSQHLFQTSWKDEKWMFTQGHLSNQSHFITDAV